MKTNSFSLPAVRPAPRKAGRPANETHIAANAIYHMPGDHRGDQIDVLTGLVWLTQAGDAEDHLLRRGESFVVTRRGTIVAQGMAESALRVTHLD